MSVAKNSLLPSLIQAD